MDRDLHRQRLERFSRSERIFPGRGHDTDTCAGCARIITDRFGGEVRGYYHAHNPTARVGEVDGAHDFAITSERFLVDPWLFHYYAEEPVLDLNVLREREEALARYGPEENWQRVPDVPRTQPGRTARAVSIFAAKAG